MAKPDGHYDDLPVSSQDVIASYAHWVVKNTPAIPANFSAGIVEFARIYRDIRVIEESVHSIYASKHAIAQDVYRVLSICPIYHMWVKNYEWKRIDTAKQLADDVWADAVRFERIRAKERKHGFIQYLLDWFEK
jgi:hypothetical protein